MKSKVSELLEKVSRSANHLSGAQLSKLEIDILMQTLRELYEELDKMRNSSIEEVVVIPRIEKIQEEVKPVTPIVTPEMKEVVHVKKEEPVEVKTSVPVQKKTGASLNEVVKPSENLNTKLKTGASKEVYHKLSSKPLKELIDMNKRFVLVGELFRTNGPALTKAIERIDNAPDYDTAYAFIKNELWDEYNWNESSKTTQLFLSLVKQKFGME